MVYGHSGRLLFCSLTFPYECPRHSWKLMETCGSTRVVMARVTGDGSHGTSECKPRPRTAGQMGANGSD